MGKKKTGTQIAKMAMDRARGRVIDNCWRAIFDFKSGEPKRLQKSIDILKHFDRLPAHGSAESILSKAAETAKKHGFNSDVKSSTPGNRATTHRSKPVKEWIKKT